MESGGDCVLRSATRIPSLHRSGVERQGHSRDPAAAGPLPNLSFPRAPGVISPLPSFQSSEQTARAVWSAARRRSHAYAKDEEIDYRVRQPE